MSNKGLYLSGDYSNEGVYNDSIEHYLNSLNFRLGISSKYRYTTYLTYGLVKDRISYYNNKNGYSYGLGYIYQFNKSIGFNISMKTFKIKDEYDLKSTNISLKFNY